MQYKKLATICSQAATIAEQCENRQLQSFYTATIYRLINGNANKYDAVNVRIAYESYSKTEAGKKLTKADKEEIEKELKELENMDTAKEYKTASKVNMQNAAANNER